MIDLSPTTNQQHGGTDNTGYVQDDPPTVTPGSDHNHQHSSDRENAEENSSTSNNNRQEESRLGIEPDLIQSNMIKETPISKPSFDQVWLLLVGSLSFVVLGMVEAWPNALAANLPADNTTLFNTRLNPSDTQMDWTGSGKFLGTALMMIPSGWLTRSLGRRRVIILSAFFLVVGWLMVAVSPNMEMIIVSRLLLGMALSMAVISTRTYIVDVASAGIRGTMLSVLEIMKGLGFLAVPSLSLVMTWYHIAFINAGLMVVYGTIIIIFFPESPAFLAVQGHEVEARQLMMRLRTSKNNVDDELKQLKLMNQHKDGQNGLAALCSKENLKTVFIVCGLYMITSATGYEVIKANLNRILKNTDLPIDPDVSTVVVTCALLCGSLTLTVLVDRWGRRWCLIISLVLLTLAYGVLGGLDYYQTTQQQLIDSSLTVTSEGSTTAAVISWVYLVSFLIMAFGANLGMIVPMILASEYFPTNIRSQGMSVCITAGHLMGFSVLQLYSIMKDALTPAGLYWTYAALCIISIIYINYFVWETKHKNVG